MALLVIAFVLPSALRPPAQQSNQSAELSPNSPHQGQSIIAAFSQAQSGTAGAGPNQAGGTGGAAGSGAATPTAVVRPVAAYCPFGYGDPPRQTSSLYAAPCAPVWQGNNGGATWHGVSADVFRVAIVECDGDYHTTYTGPTPNQPQPGESSADTTWRVYQQYFNSHFQFYGRQLQFVQTNPQPCNSTDFVQAVDSANAQWPLFAVSSPFGAATDEAQRLGLLATGLVGNGEQWFAAHQPAFEFDMSGTELTQLTSEMMCKQLEGHPAAFTVPPIKGRSRVYGAFLLADSDTTASGAYSPADIQNPLARQCGAKWSEVVTYDPYVNANLAQYLATAMTKMRAAGVTTLACFCDPFTAIEIINSASQQSYFPEWIMPGTASMDLNQLAEYYDPSQWGHALGISALEIPRPMNEQDCYKAFKEMDPGGTPQTGYLSICTIQFPRLLQLADGVQLAGPHLTPANVIKGLFKMPARRPDPQWSIGGYYGPGHWAFSDYISLVWYDPTATDPVTGNAGAYRYMLNGQRFQVGQIPTSPLPWFQSGITTVAGS
ncbi:MAG TPA: hypothetical protein VE990_08690 [Acidimicrobiales bacterium]|nr:hypothetical protein [Acidimicrobiales bacterium]